MVQVLHFYVQPSGHEGAASGHTRRKLQGKLPELQAVESELCYNVNWTGGPQGVGSGKRCPGAQHNVSLQPPSPYSQGPPQRRGDEEADVAVRLPLAAWRCCSGVLASCRSQRPAAGGRAQVSVLSWSSFCTVLSTLPTPSDSLPFGVPGQMFFHTLSSFG